MSDFCFAICNNKHFDPFWLDLINALNRSKANKQNRNGTNEKREERIE